MIFLPRLHKNLQIRESTKPCRLKKCVQIILYNRVNRGNFLWNMFLLIYYVSHVRIWYIFLRIYYFRLFLCIFNFQKLLYIIIFIYYCNLSRNRTCASKIKKKLKIRSPRTLGDYRIMSIISSFLLLRHECKVPIVK